MLEKTYVLNNEEGLHARPAATFSQAAMKFKCDLKMFKGDNEEKAYQPKSVLSVMTMGAGKGDQIKIVAEGEDEAAAIERFTYLFENDFEV